MFIWYEIGFCKIYMSEKGCNRISNHSTAIYCHFLISDQNMNAMTVML